MHYVVRLHSGERLATAPLEVPSYQRSLDMAADAAAGAEVGAVATVTMRRAGRAREEPMASMRNQGDGLLKAVTPATGPHGKVIMAPVSPVAVTRRLLAL